MTAALYVRSVLRETRGMRGRIAFFVACLAVGVAAVVAVAGLSSSIERAVRAEARELLAADVAVDSRRPVPPGIDGVIAAMPGARRTDVRRMATMAAAAGRDGAPGPSQLVQLKVVDGVYPFYGSLRLDPPRALSELLDDRSVVVAPELLSRLRIPVGGTVGLGGEEFRVAGTIVSEPDRLDAGFSIGPRVFLSGAGLARTPLVARGSRVFHRMLLALPEGQAQAAAERLRAALPRDGSYEVETYADAQPALRNGLERAGRFLGLVALLSLLIGGIGVAQTVRSWLASRMDTIAVLRCLGMRPREVTALYLGQTLLLGLVGSLVGAVAGTAVVAASPMLLSGLVNARLVSPWQPAAVARGVAMGVAVAALFALPQLAAIRRVPPLRVIRRDVEPLPPSRLARAASGIVILAGVLFAAVVQSGSARMGAEFTAGLALVTGVLAAAAMALAKGVGALPRYPGRVWIRHGLASLARPGADTLGSIVALGLGTLVVVGMYLVEVQLERSLAADLPKDAPTSFYVDIAPDQWPGVRGVLERRGASNVVSVPIVTARLAAVDGTPTEEIAARSAGDEGRAGRWALTREQNLTYLFELPADNTIVEGRWWNDPGRAEASVEVEFARDIGARPGSTLTFDVQGVKVDAVVSSLRRVAWRSFRPNFFIIVEPGLLDLAPQQRVAAARLPASGDQAAQDELAVAFPSVTSIRIREILEKVAGVVEKVGKGVRLLGAFTGLAGVAILAGAIGAGSVRRGREVALLKTLGMTRWGVAAVFAVEHALVGLVAGILGAVGGGVLAWAVVTRGMKLEWTGTALPFAVAIAGCVVVTVSAGIAASGRALARRPLEALRSD